MDFKCKDWVNRAKRKKLDYTEIINEKNDFVFAFDETANSEFKKKSKINCKNLPIDWSLKTRIRFSSKNPFPWQGQFRACDDAEGTISFVRCTPDNYNNKESSSKNSLDQDIFSPNKRLMIPPNDQKNFSDQSGDKSNTSELRRYCFTWIFPNLPWIKTFPRIDSLDKSTKNEPFFKDSKSSYCIQLKNEWCLSLKSLFHLVKARQCAFFYVCCNTFTILFRAAGVTGIDSIHAIITPTSSGLRNMLKEEGIEFTMPLIDEKDLENNEENLENVIEGTNDSGFPIEEDSQLFLESLGLSQQDFPTTKPKVASQTQKDDKRKTMVFIKGQNVNLLMTFLINTDVIVSTTGQMTGIPPTLIAPIAFSNSSLYSLKLKSTLTMLNKENIYNLDLIGPILPNIVHDITNFFKNTIKNFSATIVNCDATTPFTTFSSSTSENSANLISLFASENLKDCGLSKDLINKICKKNHQCKNIIKCIKVESNEFEINF